MSKRTKPTQKKLKKTNRNNINHFLTQTKDTQSLHNLKGSHIKEHLQIKLYIHLIKVMKSREMSYIKGPKISLNQDRRDEMSIQKIII